MTAQRLAGRERGNPEGWPPILPSLYHPRSMWGTVFISFIISTSISQGFTKPVEMYPSTNVEESLDGCDRIVWSAQTNRGVHEMSMKCSEGAVSWQQPYDAMRINFRSPYPVPERSAVIETCFSVSTHLLKVVVSRELFVSEGDAEVEGLEHLVMLDRGFPNTVRDICVRTKRPITLFIETQPGEVDNILGHVTLQYDVSVVSQDSEDSLEECRPCTEKELLVKACSSGFVVTGEMKYVGESSALKQTTIDVGVDRIYRQKTEHFSHSQLLLNNDTKSKAIRSDSQMKDTVLAPSKCGIRKGAGKFMFIGRMRLGKAILQCAPRVEDFNNVWKRAIKQGTNLCLLD